MKTNFEIMKPNVGIIDRVIRIFIGVSAFVAAYFWLSGTVQIFAYIVGLIALITGIAARCGLYTICNKSTCQVKPSKTVSGKTTALLIAFFVLLIGIESYASMVITRKKFLEDFNHMNGYYKQVLFLTGQSKRNEAKEQYDMLVTAYAGFYDKYAMYRPYVIRRDEKFGQDIQSVGQIISAVKVGVYEGDLPATHKQLEGIRPIFQEMFKRNGFSMESMALVDFHDVMETLITAADEKNSQSIVSVYSQASDLLNIVEKEDSSEGVKRIRTSLELLKKNAENNNVSALSGDAADLKKQFIAVYLLKG
jgi:hypothetical protein